MVPPKFNPFLWPYNLGGLFNAIAILVIKAMDFGIVVSEFEFQSRFYVHFGTNTLGKGMNPLIIPAMG